MIRKYKKERSGAMCCRKENKDLEEKFDILKQINKIDYTQVFHENTSFFNIENTFTWLDWRICDMLKIGKQARNLKDIEFEQQVQLFFNIFPNGRSLLHLLAIGNV